MNIKIEVQVDLQNEIDNVQRLENYGQVCVWPACLVVQDENTRDQEITEFIEIMKEKMNVHVQYLEEIKTLPDLDENEKPIPNTGGRNDLFFAVHKDDIMHFSIPRLQIGIRWIEDVLAKGNYRSPIYPERVFEYCSWEA